jgi:hypothetical protein
VTFFWENVTLAPLVAPLAPQVVFLLKTCSQSAPKVVPSLQKWSQACKSYCKRDPKVVKVGAR